MAKAGNLALEAEASKAETDGSADPEEKVDETEVVNVFPP